MGIIPYHKLILSHIFWCFNRNQADLLWQAAKSDTCWQKPYPESTYRVPGFRSLPCTVQSSYSWNRESPASLHGRFQHEHSVHLSFYSILIGFVFTDDGGQISNLLFHFIFVCPVNASKRIMEFLQNLRQRIKLWHRNTNIPADGDRIQFTISLSS